MLISEHVQQKKLMRDSLLHPCETPDELHRWVRTFIGLNIPRMPVCAGHDAPFDYLCHAYFEPSRDVVVWAPRGGGKTRLAALATLLDLLHKPTIAVRILGGSLDQSLRMWEHLLPDLEGLASHLFQTQPRAATRRIALTNGATAAILAQSQRAVRGLRVQKLRCDEVELFDPKVWEAAQLVTKSRAIPSEGSEPLARINGAVEALSTLHAPFGLMTRIVENAQRTGTRVVRWCLLDVLERCEPDRDCQTCPLWSECGGRAKTLCDGFVSIDDAVAMKKRVGLETWNAEMLCRKPTVTDCVFPRFDVEVHVRENPLTPHPTSPQRTGERSALLAPLPGTPGGGWVGGLPLSSDAPVTLAIDFGFANPFVCLWISFDGTTTFVFDEYCQPQRTIHEHLDHIAARPWPATKRVACDPAGAGRSDQTATSNIAVLKSAGYVVKSKRSGIVEGCDLIRTALTPASGEPRLFIHPRCKTLIKALQSYHYPPGGGELPLKDGEHDHCIDALRYFFVNATRDDGVRSRGY